MSALTAPSLSCIGRTRALTMRQLEVFHAIMTTGSISAAALTLHVSQPALSRALALCENRLGYTLFERVGRRLQPTPEALRLHDEAREVYRGLDRLNLLAQNISMSGVSTLHIASSAAFANAIVPAALQKLLAHSRHVRIDFRTATYEELPEYLLTGRADVALSMTAPAHHSLKAQLLGSLALTCVLPNDHPLAAAPCIDPEQLMATPWIGYPPDTPLGKLCAQSLALGIDSALIQVRSPAIALNFVQSGLGAAIVDTSCLTKSALKNCVVRPLSRHATCSIWALTSTRTTTSVASQHFIDAIQVALQEQLQPAAPT